MALKDAFDRSVGKERNSMRIQSNNTSAQIGKSGSTGRARSGSSTFSVPQDGGSTSQSQQAAHSTALSDVSSLLALQGVEDPLQGKRRKAIRKGNKMLDLLEDVRLGLLSGSLSVSVLQTLERMTEMSEPSGDARIDALVEEIGLRAQVELAKLEGRRRS